MLEITAQDMDEIIALKINGEIYGAHTAIEMARQARTVEDIYSRAVFKFMADMDIGVKWAKWCKLPTLFLLTEYNKYCEEIKNG